MTNTTKSSRFAHRSRPVSSETFMMGYLAFIMLMLAGLALLPGEYVTSIVFTGVGLLLAGVTVVFRKSD